MEISCWWNSVDASPVKSTASELINVSESVWSHLIQENDYTPGTRPAYLSRSWRDHCVTTHTVVNTIDRLAQAACAYCEVPVSRCPQQPTTKFLQRGVSIAHEACGNKHCGCEQAPTTAKSWRCMTKHQVLSLHTFPEHGEIPLMQIRSDVAVKSAVSKLTSVQENVWSIFTQNCG